MSLFSGFVNKNRSAIKRKDYQCQQSACFSSFIVIFFNFTNLYGTLCLHLFPLLYSYYIWFSVYACYVTSILAPVFRIRWKSLITNYFQSLLYPSTYRHGHVTPLLSCGNDPKEFCSRPPHFIGFQPTYACFITSSIHHWLLPPWHCAPIGSNGLSSKERTQNFFGQRIPPSPPGIIRYRCSCQTDAHVALLCVRYRLPLLCDGPPSPYVECANAGDKCCKKGGSERCSPVRDPPSLALPCGLFRELSLSKRGDGGHCVCPPPHFVVSEGSGAFQSGGGASGLCGVCTSIDEEGDECIFFGGITGDSYSFWGGLCSSSVSRETPLSATHRRVARCIPSKVFRDAGTHPPHYGSWWVTVGIGCLSIIAQPMGTVCAACPSTSCRPFVSCEFYPPWRWPPSPPPQKSSPPGFFSLQIAYKGFPFVSEAPLQSVFRRVAYGPPLPFCGYACVSKERPFSQPLRSLCHNDAYTSPFLQSLHKRGLIASITHPHEVDALCRPPLGGGSTPVSAYWGVDATGSSLHVGHLLSLMVLRRFQECGHRPIVLVGGGTALIGDPSGKEASRRLLSESVVLRHSDTIALPIHRFLRFDDSVNGALLVNNADWLLNRTMIEFLRTIGRHISVNTLLKRESVKRRLERQQKLSLLEFYYPVLQAYDFVTLHQQYNVRLQISGADQWGNILSGVDLAERLGLPPLYGLTVPLLVTLDGRKMGKSTSRGSLWLDSCKTSPYTYWQFWRNTADTDIRRYLLYFTELPIPVIDKLTRVSGIALNEAKIVLADEATRLLYGQAILGDVRRTVDYVFGGRRDRFPLQLPVVYVDETSLLKGDVTLGALLWKFEWAACRREVDRLITEGAIRLNDRKVWDANYTLQLSDFTVLNDTDLVTQSNATRVLRIGWGRKRLMHVRLSE